MSKLALVVLLWLSASFCAAQSTLTYVWTHTWPFGQQGPGSIVPADADNHVAVDPVTGTVLVTIDDQLEQASPRHDFLFSFSGDGTDLTPVPTPLLGSAVPTIDDMPNLEGTHDLAARNGVVYHARELNIGLMSGTTGSICARSPDGSDWKLGLGKAGFQYPNGLVLVDDQGTISVRSLVGFEARIQSTLLNGWPQWSQSYEGVGAFRTAVILGDRIFAASSNWIWEIGRSTGSAIGGYALPFTGTIRELATDGTRLFFVLTQGTSSVSWGCVETDGTAVWDVTDVLDITVNELAIDGAGRPWFIGNRNDGVSPPLLVVTASDGSTHDLFTYGTSMNDLAMGDGQMYITGRLDDASTTYLIAVGTDVTTAVSTPAPPAVTLFPQPASTQFTIANAGRLDDLIVHDATGKSVRVPLRNATTLDVSRLSEGIYFLQATTAQGAIARRFVVSR